MPYKYETQLRQQAQKFADSIQSELGYDATIDPKSYREYSVAVKLGDVGQATIYYSPKKETFKLVNQGLDNAVAETITTVWHNLSNTAPQAPPKQKKPLTKPKTAHQAFVDGSYHKNKKTVGYGAVILKGDEELTRLSGRVHEFTESRQIGGELEATMQVIRWCQQNDISAIDIYYDYKGIALWATGRWKTNKPISQQYKNFMQKSSVKVHWHKVESHTGVYWNDIADQLAKDGTLS